MLQFFVLLSVFVFPILSLTCNLGTAASLNAFPNNCTVFSGSPAFQDSCISAKFNTPLVPPYGSDVYFCGSCAAYQVSPLNLTVSNVTCCQNDTCQTIASAPAAGTCQSFTNSSACTSRSDCYWCGAAGLFGGIGVCQSFANFRYGPTACFAIPLVVPPPVCGAVACPPFAGPPYTVQYLTLNYLRSFGYTPITSIGGNDTVARGTGVDALSRYANTRILNNTYSFCDVDQELQNWCGVNTSTRFKYCIVSETWPQYDTWGWIQNTTFTNPALSPLFPSFCACPIPGRAYYIPVRAVDTNQHYSGACGVENTILAFYIMLMILSCIVFVFILWDTALLIIFAFQRKKGFSLGKTLMVKITIILYFLVTIPNQAIFATPPGDDATLKIAKAVLRLLGVILLLFSFAMAVFSFIEILLSAKVFGTKNHALALRLFKWFFFMVSGFFLFSALVMLAVFSWYVQYAIEFRASNITQFLDATVITGALGKAIMLTLVITQAAMMLVAGVLLAFVTYKFTRLHGRVHGMKDLLARDIGLLIALVIGIPNLGLLAFLTAVVAWVQAGTIPSYWNSSYATNMAYLWLIWAEFFTELIWIVAIAYAMRTVVKKSWIIANFKSLLGIETGSSRGSSSAMSGGASTHGTTTTAQSFDDS